MNNPILDQVMGRRSVDEDLPVPCAALPRRSYRDRLERQRQRLGPEGEETENKRENESMNADLRAVLGEAEGEEGRPDTNIIPKDAEEIDGGEQYITTRLNKVKNVVQEPSYPSGEKEKYLTPYAALTAPDATPEGMTPLDPSKVPGMAAPNKFTWSELEKATPAQPLDTTTPAAGGDTAVNAMDILLGRERGAGRPPMNAADMAATGQIATEEAALASMGIHNPVIAEAAAAKAAAALVANPDPTGGSLMPEHKSADIRKTCEVARKWI